MKIFRPKNLFIIILTQYLLQYLVLTPALAEAGYLPSLSHWQFFALVFDTLLIAAGGYIINDIIDFETDKINRPERPIASGKWSKKKAIILYVFLNLIGLEIAWSLANQVGNPNLMFIYPSAVLLLYLYSKTFKSTPLIGNIIVSIFCAGVAGIVLFAERHIYIEIGKINPLVFQKINWIFWGYIFFAFMTTFLREIIKDIEDIDGDQKAGLITLPIKYGIKKAIIWAQAILLLIIISLFPFAFWQWKNNSIISLIYTLLFIGLPLVFLFLKLRKSETKKDFKKISSWTKWMMLSGLILLILFWI